MQDINRTYDLWDEMMNPPADYFEDEVREGFLISAMMKRYWAAQLKVLAEIDKICRKHNLRWYAGFGTLLGAVRHGGFIPWDDDMDICMMREEYVHFLELAADELPDEYKIITVQLEKEYEFISARINNGVKISLSDEYLEDNFGCPYLVGLDVFPLDGLYEDENKENDRVGRIRDASQAIFCIKENKCDNIGYRDLLAKIEKDNNITFTEKDRPFRELVLLTDGMYSETGTQNAEYVAMMTNWVKSRQRYRREWFDDIIYLPFEYVHFPVPAFYEAVLWNDYGSYMNVVKGGGGHDYPLYSKQEERLVEALGSNTFRYTMPDSIRNTRDNISVSGRCIEIITMLRQVYDKIGLLCEAGEYAVAEQLKSGSAALAESLGNLLFERERYRLATNAIIDRYRDLLGRFDAAGLKDEYQNFIRETDGILTELTDIVGSVSEKKEILFLPVKAEWWNTLEPEWRQAVADENNDVYVMPLVYLEKDFIRDEGEEKNDSALFPEYVKITDIKEYDIASRHPDVVYIQVPYDGFNTTIAIPNYFYSDNLLNLTDELVYVPCYETDDPESDDDVITASLRLLIEQPAVYNADRVIVRTEAQRNVYIDTLVGLTGEDTKDYWSEKISVSKAPINADIETKAAEKAEEKRSILKHYGRDMESHKKALLMEIDPAFVLFNGIKAIDKVRKGIQYIKNCRNSVVCIFTPHVAEEQFKKILGTKNDDLLREYRTLIEEIKSDEDIIYDEDRLVELFKQGFADAYYGTTGAMGHRCSECGIPVMYLGEC